VSSRIARDDEVEQWQTDGWVVVEGLIDPDEIAPALEDLFNVFPRPESYHSDPVKFTPRGRTNEELRKGYPQLPETGPAFRPEQHRWGAEFPFYGTGALNRLACHPSILDFAERALATPDIRLYQCQASAKYTGSANYEQPLHTDRNHGFLPPPPGSGPPWWHLETFLYLSDVDDDTAPTHFVSRPYPDGISLNNIYMPDNGAELYGREQPARGVRGSLLAYRNDVFHRAVNMTRPGGSRFFFNASFKRADYEWIGYTGYQSRSTHPNWIQLAGECTPRQLEVFGFPKPGHPIWTDELLGVTAERYPTLDLSPWREALDAQTEARAEIG
jgi:hypothetical protein